MAFSKEKAHERAEKLAAKGQHDKAAREYQSIVEHDPKDVRAWLMLASSLARAGDEPGAISRYLQVADFYSSQKDRQKALAVYRQVLGLDPNRLDIHYKCANLNLELGRVHDAIASFEQIGQAQLQAGHTGDALKTYKVIADADSSVVSKRLRLAELYSREQMVDEAVAAFREAGDILLEQDRKTDFVRVAERLVYHRADDQPTMLALARVYLDLGDPRRALMKLNGVLQADHEHRAALELLAETFIALGKPDKATSVLVELVRELRAKGGEGLDEAARVVARGLGWEPRSPELVALRDELAAASAPPPEDDENAPLELDIDDSDVVELDDDDVVLAEEDEPAATLDPEPLPSPGVPSLTERVISDVVSQPKSANGEEPTDFDKILFEARVYIKYRLFDHALEHIESLIGQEPGHIAALSLKARALTELSRGIAAADTHVEVARLVAARDPKLALEHAAAALAANPDHVDARALQAELEASTPLVRPAGGRTGTMADGDSGAFDLLDGDSGAVDVGEDDDGDFSIEVTEAEADDVAPDLSYPPIEIENRFGISEAGPLPERTGVAVNFEDSSPDLQPHSSSPAIESAPAIPAASPPSSQQRTEGTPAAGFVARPPEPDPDAELVELDADVVEFDVDHDAADHDDVDQDDVDIDVASSQPSLSLDGVPGEVGAANSADFVGFDVDPESFADVSLDAAIAAQGPADAIVEGEPDIEVAAPPEPAQPQLAPTPSKAIVPPGGWPDLSDDLAEIRFFVDQGLDEDAEAALADLRERHAGHPELEEEKAETLAVSVEAPASQSGSKPLLDLVTEEDAEADAYLAAIFGGGEAPVAKERKVTVQALAADTQGSSPRDHFDLGMAYREMGLTEAAIVEFEAAAVDEAWASRARVMLGTMRAEIGQTDSAISDFQAAVDNAVTDDERHEARYELGLLHETLGDATAALELLTAVKPGFRDRDEKLETLRG